MYPYAHVLLSELHLDPVSPSLSTSRRAAQRFAQLEALQDRAHPSRPAVRAPRVRRLLALVRRPQRTPA